MTHMSKPIPICVICAEPVSTPTESALEIHEACYNKIQAAIKETNEYYASIYGHPATPSTNFDPIF